MPRNSATSTKSVQVRARVLQNFEHEGTSFTIGSVVEVDEELLLPYRDCLDAAPAAVDYAEKTIKRAARLRELNAEIAAFE